MYDQNLSDESAVNGGFHQGRGLDSEVINDSAEPH